MPGQCIRHKWFGRKLIDRNIEYLNRALTDICQLTGLFGYYVMVNTMKANTTHRTANTNQRLEVLCDFPGSAVVS